MNNRCKKEILTTKNMKKICVFCQKYKKKWLKEKKNMIFFFRDEYEKHENITFM